MMINNKNNLRFILYLLVVVAFISGCANMGMPSGGEKDEKPPEIVKSEPANFSTNFQEKRIKIYFDEYIVQKNLTKQLIISPPMEEKPEIKVKGKILQIDLMADLLENTTYSINFGNSIADNNEGNQYKDLQYVFATGDRLDSLRISGEVLDAFTQKPVEDVVVMLYKNNTDSAPIKELPFYVGRCDEKGFFNIRNISDTTYKIFALVDKNQNYLYDQAGEQIAFLDSLLLPGALITEQIDTIKIDSLEQDSIVKRIKTEFFPKDLVMSIFTEPFVKQYLKSKERVSREMITFIFNEPLKDSLSIRELNGQWTTNDLLADYSANKDTINFWFKDSTIYKNDSMQFLLDYQMTDSLNQLVPQTDTILLTYKENKKKKKKGEKEKSGFGFKTNLKSGTLDINKKIWLTFNEPIQELDKNKFFVQERVDTLFNPIDFVWEKDSINIKKYHLSFSTNPEEKYQVIIDTLAFTSIYGNQMDSAGYNFDIQKEEYYGQLIVNLLTEEKNVIIHLLSDKDIQLRELKVNKSGKYPFTYLAPATYKLRLISDSNGNGKWDPGDYLKGGQPEQVIYHKEAVQVRSNWELEADLEL